MSDNTGPRNWLAKTLREHRLPLLLLIPPITLAVWSTGLEIGLFLFAVPIASALIGYFTRPRHVWLIWLGAVVIQWAAMGALGKYIDPQDETVGSLLIEAFPWMAMGVLLPTWLGRTARNLKASNPSLRRQPLTPPHRTLFPNR